MQWVTRASQCGKWNTKREIIKKHVQMIMWYGLEWEWNVVIMILKGYHRFGALSKLAISLWTDKTILLVITSTEVTHFPSWNGIPTNIKPPNICRTISWFLWFNIGSSFWRATNHGSKWNQPNLNNQKLVTWLCTYF